MLDQLQALRNTLLIRLPSADNRTDNHMNGEQAVAVAIDVYLGAGIAIEEMDRVKADAKHVIAEVMAETGRERFETQAGTVLVTAPGKTVTYDTKALDALCASDDQIARLLRPHRKETERAGVMMIRRPTAKQTAAYPDLPF